MKSVIANSQLHLKQERVRLPEEDRTMKDTMPYTNGSNGKEIDAMLARQRLERCRALGIAY